MTQRQAGLTLIELMVTVAVLAILATVAYPLYTAQVQKARRADGRVAVTMMAAAQERVFTRDGRYTTTLGDLGFGSGTSEQGFYTLAVVATTTTFDITATATGNQVADDCDTMTIDETGTKGGTGTGCWP